MMVESKQQLEALLGDPGYARTIAALTKEVMRSWNLSYADARGVVLSAIGEPAALASIYQAWVAAKTGDQPGLPALISRRRVLDLLGKDARRPRHSSLPHAAGELESDASFRGLHTGPDGDLRGQVERQQIIHLMRGAIACFAAQGAVQWRQANLVWRRTIEEISYTALSHELGCNESALRVRVHAAMKALHRHILQCHPDLYL